MTSALCYESLCGGGPFSTPAVSQPADKIKRQLEDISRRYRGTSFGRALEQTVEKIRIASADAAKDNWDGYGARPADSGSYPHALRLLRLIPVTIPPPDIAIDPDGEISLDWHREPRRTFSISVGPQGRLSYGGLFGKSSTHGTEAYFSDELPAAIRAGLHRVFS